MHHYSPHLLKTLTELELQNDGSDTEVQASIDRLLKGADLWSEPTANEDDDINDEDLMSTPTGGYIRKEEYVSQPIRFDEEPLCIVYSNWHKAKKNGKWGLFDGFGYKWLLEPIYDDIIENCHECVVLHHGDKVGIFSNCFFVPAIYDDIWFGMSLSYVRFKKNESWGYIDIQGQWTEDIDQAHVFARNPMYWSSGIAL